MNIVERLAYLREIGAKPTMTLEAHDENDLWESLNNIKNMNLLDF